VSTDLFEHAGVDAPAKEKITTVDRPRAQAAAAPGQVIGVGTGGDLWNPAFEAAGLTRQDTVAWWPTRSSGDGTTLPAKDLALARVRDIIRNDPTARAAIERFVDLIVGPGLHLSAIPDGTALGIKDPEVLRKFARSIESEWRLFADDPRRLCDVQRRLSMNGLFRLFARTWFTCGETTAVLMWRDAPGRRYATCVMPIDPDRLCNPNGMYETLTLRGGVEMDAVFQEPTAYHIRNAHIGDWWASMEAWTWTRVPRTTKWGRPIFVHGFEPEREGVTRAISPFAALLTRLKMIGKFADAELASASLNALFSAFVETDLPLDDVAKSLAPSAPLYADRVVEHFTKHPAMVGGVRIPVLPPGSKITMNSSTRESTSFASFQMAFLQSIASALGLSYEQLSMDFTKANYSSIRAALNETWRSIKRISRVFVEQVVTPVYYAFLEEAFDKGHLVLPAGASPLIGHNGGPRLDALDVFHAIPGALMRARWIGPGRGYVDPLKEAQASAMKMEAMVSTLEKECAEQGESFEEVLDQIAVEEGMLKDRKLTRLSLVAAVQATRGPKPDSEEAEGPAGPDDDAQNKAAPS
jgi:lambda family phage portal protein